MSEVAGHYKYSLRILVLPYATESSTDRLRYDIRRKHNVPYQPALPERVVADLVGQIEQLTSTPGWQAETVENAPFKHFISRCGESNAINVVASLIAHNSGAYYKLDDIDKYFSLPFTIDEPVQRRLLRAATQFEYSQLDEAIKKQEKEHASWDGLPKLRLELQELREFLIKIDEKEGAPVTQAQLA